MSIERVISASSQSTLVRLFFDQTSDEHFLVLAELPSAGPSEAGSYFIVRTFEHEDEFLKRIIDADLSMEDTARLAGTVIRSLDQDAPNQHWLELALNEEQRVALALDEGEPVQPVNGMLVRDTAPSSFSLEFTDSASQFYQFLMQSPTPFVMLTGPEHRFAFINQPYVDLIGQSTREEILMRPVRHVLPELEGQPFFRLLDEVFRTGEPYVGKEQLAHIRSQYSAGFEDRYFDFIYYPVRNSKGNVYGVMVQAADVTERVQTREVSEQREEQLFRQWAELDAIYRTAPVGMALLDGKSLRLLRLNEKHAELMGAPVGALLGRDVLELKTIAPALASLFKRVGAGESVRNAIVEKEARSGDTAHRTWLVNISPFLGASGEVIAFTCVSLEVPDEP